MAKAKRQAVKQLVAEAEKLAAGTSGYQSAARFRDQLRETEEKLAEAEKERDELKVKLFSAEHLADASVVLLEQLECARKVNESISAKWGEAEAKLAEALEDARAARRERDEAVRVRDEMDTDAQHRAERYCHEKRLAERERDKALVEIVRLQKCIDSIACMLGWMNTPPQDTLEKSISALNARVKELEETVRLRDEKLALEAETIALNHDASKRGWRELAALKAEIAELKRERDELKAKLAEAENLLRTDSHGDIRSVFEMEGRAEKAEAERDGLKGQLARAETRERDLEVVNSRVEADYAELERERDEARAERDEGQKRIEKLDAALQFYAGRKREDGNGYEFDDEPSRITGGVARAALRAVLR